MRVASTLSVVLGSLALASLAAAQPAARPAPPAKVPMVSVPCIPDGEVELLNRDGEPVVCWPGGCMAPALTTLDAAMVPKPAPTSPWIGAAAEVRTVDGGLAACAGPVCKPLGAKLQKAIADARTDVDWPLELGVTTDLKTVAFRNQGWTVGKDKPIAFKAPKSYRGQIDKPTLGGVEVAGNLLVTQWSNCAGPCTVAQLTDASGKNLGDSFAGGGPALQVDADRFALISEYGDVELVTGKGKHIGGHKSDGDPVGTLKVVRLDLGSFAILRDDPSGSLRLETLYAMSGDPRIAAARSLPRCTAP